MHGNVNGGSRVGTAGPATSAMPKPTTWAERTLQNTRLTRENLKSLRDRLNSVVLRSTGTGLPPEAVPGNRSDQVMPATNHQLAHEEAGAQVEHLVMELRDLVARIEELL